ncbi:MAG: hypothetical protein IPO48_06355 [Saprospiraceae bacterium]|nr:hypothetical protein [Saprospiraceae bacterium]
MTKQMEHFPLSLQGQAYTISGKFGMVKRLISSGSNSATLFISNIISGNRYRVLVYTNWGLLMNALLLVMKYETILGGNLNYACNDLVNISLNDACVATVTPDMILEGDTDNSLFEVAIFVNGVNIGNAINSTHLGKMLEVRVYHKCSGNYCWGKIFVEDKLPPVITCPADYTVSCLNNGFVIPTPTFADACDPTATIRLVNNVLEELACNHFSGFRAVRTLTYIAQDKYGNTSAPCTFKVNYRAIDINETVWPANAELSCEPIVWDRNGNGYPDPQETGFPKIGNIDLAKAVANNPKAVTSDNYCRVNVTFNDIVIPLCNPTYKIVREWVVLDWCNNSIVRHSQLIKLVDQGVVVSCPPVQVIYADGYSCSADWTVVAPSLQIKCSPTTWTVAFKKGDGSLIPPSDNVPFVTVDGQTRVTGSYPNFKIVGLPAGRTWIRYSFVNECGFEIFCTTEIDVIDQVKPTPVCDETTVVSLSSNGQSRIYAHSVDDGSHDNCSEVTLAIRRMTNNCALSADARFIYIPRVRLL